MNDSRRQGFTLIEMLVVIAIIAILASIILASASGAIQAAKKNRALSECSSGAIAVENYFADYKKYPVATQMTAEPNSEDVVIVLTAQDTGVNASHVLNSRKKVYLSVNQTTGSSTTAGQFRDPWGGQYKFILDDDFDGKTQIPGHTQDYFKRCIVISSGKNKTFGDDDDVSHVALPYR